MSDTIFYKGKLKRGKKPLEVFEKIKKGIKKKGPTKGWVCTIDEEKEELCIVFPDGESENFVLRFNEKGEFEDFCKIYFPLEGNYYEDGKSEFKALLDILYKVKSVFHHIEITDEYGLAESYWDSKRFKFDLRELTSEEEARVRRLYSVGHVSHESLLRAIMAEDMEMSIEDLYEYVNIDVADYSGVFPKIYSTLQAYVYETAEFQNEGRLCELPDYQYFNLGNVSYSIFAFSEGLSWIFLDGTGYSTSLNVNIKSSFSQKDAQVCLLYKEKFAPLFVEENDSLKKCLLVYRYFVSVYDFLGFKYVGRCKTIKTVMDEINEEYGEEKGNIFLTCFCTYERYTSVLCDKRSEYEEQITRNIEKRYGQTLFREYLEFEKKYRINRKFMVEATYMSHTKMKYIDDSLAL